MDTLWKQISAGLPKKARPPSAYEKVIRKLDAVLLYLKDLANQRQRLLKVIHSLTGQKKMLDYTKMDPVTDSPPSCCREFCSEDLQLLLIKAFEAVQCATMETNLVRNFISSFKSKEFFINHLLSFLVPRNDPPDWQQLRFI